jgi:hypothetical protein
MLLLAEDLFRLDVVVLGDTLQSVVRNLSSGELQLERGLGVVEGTSLAFGEAAAYEPGRTRIRFALGAGSDRVTVNATIAVLHFSSRGTVRVTTQAIVRRATSE